MKTEDFESRINDLLDQRLAPAADPQLLTAANESAELRQLLMSYAALADGIGQLTAPECPTDLADRVLTAWKQAGTVNAETDAEPSVLKFPRGGWFFGAAAAAILVAVVPAWRLFHAGDAQPLTQRAPEAKPIEVAAASPTIPATVQTAPAVANARAEQKVAAAQKLAGYAQMVRRAGTAVADLALLMPELPLQSEGNTDERSPSNTPERDVVGEMGQGLEPLANSAVGALDFLFEVLPSADDASRS